MDYNEMIRQLGSYVGPGAGGTMPRVQALFQRMAQGRGAPWAQQYRPQQQAPSPMASQAAPQGAPAPDYSQWSPNQVSQETLRGLMPPPAQGKPTLASFNGVPYQFNPNAAARQAEIGGLNKGMYNPVLGMKR